MPGTDATLTLRDGRTLGYRVAGPAAGVPVVYLHGCPGSRLDLGAGGEALCDRLGVRLAAPDRPGIGTSDPQRGRRLTDLADDVAQLADALSFDRFSVYGLSAGAPYALACAAALADRVAHVLLVSAVSPAEMPKREEAMADPQRFLYMLARRAPFLLGPGYSSGRRKALRDPDALLADFRRDASPADREILERPQVRETFLTTFTEATRQSGRAVAADLRLWVRPWGVDLDRVRAPVVLVHGDADRLAPVRGAEHLAETLHDATLIRHPGEGHLLAYDRAEELLVLAAGAGAT